MNLTDNAWLVLSNSNSAYIYKISKNRPEFQLSDPIHSIPRRPLNYELVTKLAHAQGREKTKDLVSDKPGHYGTSGINRGSFVPETERSEIEKTTFAREVADYLEKHKSDKSFNKVIICVPSKFYGLLKKELSSDLANKIGLVIQKDYIPKIEKKMDGVLTDITESITVRA